MKKVWLGLIAAVLILASSVSFADDRDFTIDNATGYPIKFLGVNAPDDNVWNVNELASTLQNGGSFKVKFTGADKGCIWNIKVIWADDNSSSYFSGLNLCSIEVVNLHYNRSTDTASYTTQ